MIPLALLALAPFAAADAGLAWEFDGAVAKEKGRYRLKGKAFSGEVAWYVAPQGRFDAQKLYESDTARTKDADAVVGFSHTRTATVFAGMPAIRSDQRYLWDNAPFVSTCVYCAEGNRAWVVRLWWAPFSGGEKAAEAFLRTVRREEAKGKG